MVAAIGCLFVAGVVCAAEPFNYFVNDWSVVSLTDYNRGTRISTQNGLVISGDNERKEHEGDVTVRIRFGRKLELLSRKQNKTWLDGWIPVVSFAAMDGDMQYNFKIWATPLPTMKDWKKAYDWPTELFDPDDPPKREPPKRIVLHLPKSRPLVKPAKGIEVVYRSDQKKRWDWPTIVKLYKKCKTFVPLSNFIK